jgi:hypothetical protein
MLCDSQLRKTEKRRAKRQMRDSERPRIEGVDLVIANYRVANLWKAGTISGQCVKLGGSHVSVSGSAAVTCLNQRKIEILEASGEIAV